MTIGIFEFKFFFHYLSLSVTHQVCIDHEKILKFSVFGEEILIVM